MFGKIRNRQSRDSGNIGHTRHMTDQVINKRQRKPKGQTGMENSEKLATLGTQDTWQMNVRKNRRGNQEWKIQRNWQHWVHNTQDK